ncbi:MAG: hypothetical protein ANABAC_3452 [Anaerolineae bacterium]|nr:MAG: hypothetical protein ANABAC_3452 [Anaerolineae bacterium]
MGVWDGFNPRGRHFLPDTLLTYHLEKRGRVLPIFPPGKLSKTVH